MLWRSRIRFGRLPKQRLDGMGELSIEDLKAVEQGIQEVLEL